MSVINAICVQDVEGVDLDPAQLFVAQLAACAVAGRNIGPDRIDHELEDHPVGHLSEDLRVAARFGAALQIEEGHGNSAAGWILDETERINMGIKEHEEPTAADVSSHIRSLENIYLQY